MATIMLIDDDVVLLKLYSTRFTADGHQVITALNGEDAISKIKMALPNLIVLDLLMPKMNGFSFLEKLATIPGTAAIPKIVFSSVANSEQIDRLKKMGISDYVNKTDITPTQLVTLINQRLKPA